MAAAAVGRAAMCHPLQERLDCHALAPLRPHVTSFSRKATTSEGLCRDQDAAVGLAWVLTRMPQPRPRSASTAQEGVGV